MVVPINQDGTIFDASMWAPHKELNIGKPSSILGKDGNNYTYTPLHHVSENGHL